MLVPAGSPANARRAPDPPLRQSTARYRPLAVRTADRARRIHRTARGDRDDRVASAPTTSRSRASRGDAERKAGEPFHQRQRQTLGNPRGTGPDSPHRQPFSHRQDRRERAEVLIAAKRLVSAIAGEHRLDARVACRPRQQILRHDDAVADRFLEATHDRWQFQQLVDAAPHGLVVATERTRGSLRRGCFAVAEFEVDAECTHWMARSAASSG